jgi:hypothetical protein
MRLIFCILCLVAGYFQAHPRQIDQNEKFREVSPLFREEKSLKINLHYSKTNMLAVTNDSTYLKSNLRYQFQEEEPHTLAIELRARGNYRKKNCYYLPLKLKIDKHISKGTPFEEDQKLKLVLPCLKSNQANDHVIKELLAYKIYELLSPYYFQTRLVSVALEEDTGKKKIDHDLMGILIQDDKSLAHDYRGNIIKRRIHPKNQDALSSVRNALFQYMIGNTDYSTAYQHNEKLFYLDDKIVPVPYDFDMAGLVNTSYAVVSAIKNKPLPIQKVTDRLFIGFEREEAVFQEVRKDFLAKETLVFEMMDRHEKFFKDSRELEEAKKFLEGFYKILVDDKKFESKILNKARTKLD